jgi:peptidoglycan hydrolase-like protein with peptidoglycan-binding domain
MLQIAKAVGRGAPNLRDDVIRIQARLNEIGKDAGPADGQCGPKTLAAIDSVQDHFMLKPDGVISPDGNSIKFLAIWKVKKISPGVQLPGGLRTAWDTLNPILPDGSFCISGYRSADDQRRILRNFYASDYRAQLIAKYGQKKYDQVLKGFDGSTGAGRETWEDEMLAMVHAMGQAIAKPGRSAHQKGKAFDIGGPSAIDAAQVRIAQLVAKANPQLFSGKVLKERNGCVHVEIL